MIEMMKASAGSGKTFNLTKKYINLLLSSDDPHEYRHILAVTFTNKATDEMKNRILKELHALATDTASSPYLNEFVPSLFKTQSDLQKKAENVLVNLLHDYSAFAVSTIDKFFQQTLKAFSREIGQFSSYQVELDKESLVAESVDRVLDSLSEEKSELLSWLKEGVMSRLEEGKRYDMDSRLLEIANGLKSEARRRLVEKFNVDEKETTSRQSLKKTKAALISTVSSYEQDVVNAAKAFGDAFTNAGMDPMLTSRGFAGKCIEFYGSLTRGMEIPVPSATVQGYAVEGSYQKWFAANVWKKNRGIYEPNESVLFPIFQDFIALFQDKRYKVYRTALTLLDQIQNLGIAAELNEEYKALLKEKNIMCLEDSNTILKGIIDGSDAPFIYEKIGVRFDHFLLDEFQDTSKVQWDNFKPLVLNSHSTNGYNLLVGDVKQSIYRWRGSDWDLMAKDVPTELGSELKTLPLNDNYRSLKNIVEFNNKFFKYASESLDKAYPVMSGNIPISDIYSDVKQGVKVSGEDGSVEVIFANKDIDQGDLVVQKIDSVRKAGAKWSDIAVLVRTNDMASEIAETLMASHIPVISDEALLVKSSVTVRRLASLMSLVNSPTDTIGGFLANLLGMTYIPKGSLSLQDMAESIARKLRDSNPEMFENESQYIQAFMDNLQDFVSVNGNNLAEFLKFWADANPSIGSPAGADSVRVMTIHKSKGLEFPYVIVPYAQKTDVFKWGPQWSHPDVEGTSLEGVVNDVYHVNLSEKATQTLFEGDYQKEQYLQHIDAINTFYVALTRAGMGLCVISEDVESGSKNFAQLLKAYMEDHPEIESKECFIEYPTDTVSDEDDQMQKLNYVIYSIGQLYDYSKREEKKRSEMLWESSYPSFPLNMSEESEGGPVRGRLRIHGDSVDFFKEDGSTGVEASNRIKGIVLHNILSDVRVPSDLDAAVKKAVHDGDLTVEQGEEAFELLSRKIESVQSKGWFPEDPSRVLNEATIMDADGSEHRPDRVVITEDGGVIIVDYKFGGYQRKYKSQLSRYEDLYRRMGYNNVTSYLWYVNE